MLLSIWGGWRTRFLLFAVAVGVSAAASLLKLGLDADDQQDQRPEVAPGTTT